MALTGNTLNGRDLTEAQESKLSDFDRARMHLEVVQQNCSRMPFKPHGLIFDLQDKCSALNPKNQ